LSYQKVRKVMILPDTSQQHNEFIELVCCIAKNSAIVNAKGRVAIILLLCLMRDEFVPGRSPL